MTAVAWPVYRRTAGGRPDESVAAVVVVARLVVESLAMAAPTPHDAARAVRGPIAIHHTGRGRCEWARICGGNTALAATAATEAADGASVARRDMYDESGSGAATTTDGTARGGVAPERAAPTATSASDTTVDRPTRDRGTRPRGPGDSDQEVRVDQRAQRLPAVLRAVQGDVGEHRVGVEGGDRRSGELHNDSTGEQGVTRQAGEMPGTETPVHVDRPARARRTQPHCR